jgi:hypothetical protein
LYDKQLPPFMHGGSQIAESIGNVNQEHATDGERDGEMVITFAVGNDFQALTFWLPFTIDAL